MLSRSINNILRRSYCRTLLKCRNVSSQVSEADTKDTQDPAPLFFDEEVQKLLETITRVDYNIVTRPRMDGQKRSPPTYQFMTTEELEEATRQAKIRLKSRIQMPPVVKTRKEIDKVLSYDPALQGYDKHNYVFTDITYGHTDRSRLITVREPNGKLRYAKWDERHRVNQIYFPLEGREWKTPQMFFGDAFRDILDRGEYVYILDRACLQFDPDDPHYQEVTEKVYLEVHRKKHYNQLRSTRHFGPMAFYLAWNKDIDDLLKDMIEFGKIEEARSLVQLYYKLNPPAPEDPDVVADDIAYINYFISTHAIQKLKIKKTLAVYQELEREKKKLEEYVQRAHVEEKPSEI